MNERDVDCGGLARKPLLFLFVVVPTPAPAPTPALAFVLGRLPLRSFLASAALSRSVRSPRTGWSFGIDCVAGLRLKFQTLQC